jgi:DNA polymerase III subunit epsilon
MMRTYNQIDYRHLDIQSISYMHKLLLGTENETNSLSKACEYFNISRKEIHNALDDTKVLLDVYKKILIALGEFKDSSKIQKSEV